MSFIEQILEEEMPCDGCVMRSLCAVQKLACAAYVAYCNLQPWRAVEHLPNATTFNRLYRTHSAKEYAKLEERLAEMRLRKRVTMELNGSKPGRKGREELEEISA